MSLSADIKTKVRASFARQSLMGTFGAELLSLGRGAVTVAAPVTEAVLQQHGVAHAGLTFALGDTAAGYAALTMIDGAADVMTAEMKVNLLRPAAGDRLVAEGRVIKPGRRLIVVQAEVYAEVDGARTQIALMQGTMVPA
ncbi:MAG: PaaI family thioesterase [Paracoccaceae bacterium]|nr:PaaI family thioesterase [Paracoccaceae bacterium]